MHTTAETAASSLPERPSVGSTAAGCGNAQPHPHPSYQPILHPIPSHLLPHTILIPIPHTLCPILNLRLNSVAMPIPLFVKTFCPFYIWRCVLSFVFSFLSSPFIQMQTMLYCIPCFASYIPFQLYSCVLKPFLVSIHWHPTLLQGSGQGHEYLLQALRQGGLGGAPLILSPRLQGLQVI